MSYKIGDRFVVIKRPGDSWSCIGYHLLGWKGTVTGLDANSQPSECRWDNTYFKTNPSHANEMPVNYQLIKKIGTKKISCFAYWNMLYGK